MKIDEIEMRIMKLGYSIQDLDSEISKMDIPQAQISSAGQLANIHGEKGALIKKRNLLRKQMVELEQQRQTALQEREKNREMQHKKSMHLSKIGIWTNIVFAVLGRIVK